MVYPILVSLINTSCKCPKPLVTWQVLRVSTAETKHVCAMHVKVTGKVVSIYEPCLFQGLPHKCMLNSNSPKSRGTVITVYTNSDSASICNMRMFS